MRTEAEEINFHGHRLIIKALFQNSDIHYIVNFLGKNLQVGLAKNGKWRDWDGAEHVIAKQIGEAIEDHFE